MATTGEPFGLFWDSENGDRTYSAASFEYWLKKFFTSGVFNGDLQVKAKSGMTLEIDPGYANVDGKVKFWNGAFTITLDAANSTYPRIDTIVIRRDNVNRQIICEKVTGSYSADTPQPTALTRNSEIYDLVTAQIYVGAGVTEITQSNITDTRPNNELCGYITGTVEELDFSAFTAQFEAYFAEFKSNQMADFQAWEVAQQAAYAAWFSLVQQQQRQDKADWDAWYAALQEELHELPADTAEYLQIEIDEIRTSGTTGSILKITTTETSLEGKTVTVTNGTETRTATFDENLECLIAGYKGTGEVTISSSDGIQTASTVVTIPYFGNYQYAIAFWAATVNIQGDDNLKGATITVKDSDDLTVDTVVLSAITGRGVFTAQKADTYTFNYTYQGTDYSESLVVSEQTTYNLSLSAGFNWRGWVDTARFLDSSDYNSLDEVLADEEAVRELCLEHACVDYLADIATTSADVETIIENDLFAKWVNNSDYALDFLGANVVIKALMDEADKYFYGEWVITDDTTTPPTWGAKGNVPVMTANSAPYGTAFASLAASGYEAYKVFDRNTATYWNSYQSSGTSGANQYIGYNFVNPLIARAVTIYPHYDGNLRVKNFKIQASNDGFSSDVNTLYTGIFENDASEAKPHFITFDNDTAYLSYRLYVVDGYQSAQFGINVCELQFYGRELKVSVPAMTGNTTPYGEIFKDGNTTATPLYIIFDNDDSTKASNSSWNQSKGECSVGYDFTNKFVPKMFVMMLGATPSGASINNTSTFKIQGYDGQDWEDLTEALASSNFISKKVLDLTNLDSKEYIKMRCHFLEQPHVAGSHYDINTFCTLNFYGLDYSEKEFEQGTTKKWLYDHGLLLNETTWDDSITYHSSYTRRGSIEQHDSYFRLLASDTQYSFVGRAVNDTIDFTDYSLVRVKDAMGGNKTPSLDVTSLNTSYYLVLTSAKAASQTNGSIAISSSKTNMYSSPIEYVYYTDNLVCDISELWLE